ncbi:RNA polymerase II assembly factor RTP1, partial [Colletotrichum shisoi]
METDTPERDRQSKLAGDVLDAGKRAFDPAIDVASREAAQREFQHLINENGSWNLLPVLNALVKPNVAPTWLRPELMKILTLIPLRPDGVRGTMEFIFSVHPSSTLKASEAATPQKRGANITQEAMAVVTRILTSPPASISPEDWFSKVAPQLIVLLDGNEGAELSTSAAQIIMFGVLGRRQFGAPGSPGWNVFVEPLLHSLNPSRKGTGVTARDGPEEHDVVDLSDKAVLTTADDLFATLRRMSSLINSTPYPAQTKRLLDPVLPQLWAISCQSRGDQKIEERYSKPARSLLHTFLKLSVSVSKLQLVIENLLYEGELVAMPRWRYQTTSDGCLQISAIPLGQGPQLPELDWNEIQIRSEALIRLMTASCTPEEISSFFLELLGRWLQSTTSAGKTEVLLRPENDQSGNEITQLLEIAVLQKMLERIPDKLVSRVTQVYELACQILDPSGLRDQPDDIIAVALSLLNLVITAPNFKRSNLKAEVLQNLEASLELLSKAGRPEVSPTAKNLQLLLRYREAIDPAEEDAFVPTNRQIEDRRTYKLALEYITQADNPPPIRSEGLNLISGLVASNSTVLDMQATLVLLSSLLQDGEDFINLRVVKLFTQLANKHPKATTQELLEHYLDAKETSSTDVRLRFGEALVQVIERLGETFAGDVAKRISETLLSIAGRRGHRPKTEAKQAREQRLQDMKKKQAEDAWGGDVPDLGDDLTEEEQAKNEILTQIVEGWESKRGSEDVRMRASALSVFSAGLETNIAGIGPDLVSIAVDLCINVLALEREIEKGIIRRAAIFVVLGFVKALDAAKQSGRRLGFGLTDQSREDITRTLKYVAVTDNDGLVQQHARDFIESLEAWQLSSMMSLGRSNIPVSDSDDSDDGFDLGDDSPMKPPTSKIPSGDRSSDSASVATGSTDPKFFQALYAEQQRAAANEALPNHDRSSTSDDPSSLAAPAKPQAKKDSTTTTSSSLPSIPDPAMGTHRAKKAGKTRVVVDLTQVITQGRSNNATPRDMWDVPSSPASDQAASVLPISSKARTPCSNKKRKRGDKMEATSPLATGISSQGSTQPFDATPATRTNAGSGHETKRWRLGNPESSIPAEDDVDMVVPLDVADVPSFRDLVSGQKPISLCIEPPQTLSASQRQEYKYHSVDPSQEDQAPVPTQPFSALPATARSSGATTIAYSTPSQTRVVGRPLATFADHTTLDTVPERTQEISKAALDPEATVEILSFPDIISAAPARRKRGRDDDNAYKTVETHQADASWDSNGTGFHCETYMPRTSRKGAGDGCWQDQTEHREETNVPAPDMGAAAQSPTGESALASPPKVKKRGRPRKSEVAAVASTVAIEAPVPRQATESDDVAKESTG